MISLLLTALLCAYSFSATAAEGKNSQELGAEIAACAGKVDPKTGCSALLTHIVTSRVLISNATSDMRKIIDLASAKTALTLIDAGEDVFAKNNAELTPFDAASLCKEEAPRLHEVISSHAKIWQKGLLRGRRAQQGLSTQNQDAEIAALQATLNTYRTQPSTTGN